MAATHNGEARCSETSVNVTRDDVEWLVNGMACTSFEQVEYHITFNCKSVSEKESTYTLQLRYILLCCYLLQVWTLCAFPEGNTINTLR